MIPAVQNAVSSSGLDANRLREVLEVSTKEVFQIMLSSELLPVSEPGSAAQCDFTAMVGLAGNMCGVLSLRCACRTATLIASKMLGLPPEEVEKEQWDAAGEVCNMIAGSFKSKLPGMEDQCLLSVPTVITGADYSLYSLADGGRVEIPFRFEDELIWISLELHS